MDDIARMRAPEMYGDRIATPEPSHARAYSTFHFALRRPPFNILIDPKIVNLDREQTTCETLFSLRWRVK
jgi:hypothetical protein